MLPQNDSLRRLPTFVDPVDRVRVEALLFSSDLASLALERIETRVRSVPWGPSKLSLAAQRELFSDAWTIVDATHVLRQLLTIDALENLGEKAKAWHADQSATLMRNGMDHLPKIARNAALKENGNPLFGILSIFRLKALAASPLEYQLIILHAGANAKGAKGNVTIPGSFNHILPSVELCAFGQQLNLAASVRTFQPVLHAAADLARRQISEGAKALGLSEQDVQALRPSIDDYPLTMIMEGTVAGT